MTADIDVLVAGCGPVGGVLAALLGAQGVRVMVIDPNAGPYPRPRAAALDADVLRILARLPGLAKASGWATALRRTRVLAPDHRALFTIDIPDDDLDSRQGSLIDQPELEGMLWAGLATLSTVELRTGRSVAAVEPGDDHVDVVLDNGERVRACWLVGCDGASSIVRELLGVAYEGVSFPEPWLVVDARISGDSDEPVTLSYVLDPRRPMVHMSRPGARRWEWMLLPGEDPDRMASDQVVRELVDTWLDPATIRVDRAAAFTFHARMATRWRQGRVLLAGDAAHSMPPFIGQGLGSGLRDAANLAWRLAAVVRGLDGDELLDGYERERRPDVRAMTTLALRLGRIVQTRRPLPSALLRSFARTLGAVPGLEAFAARRGAPPAHLPRGTAGPHPGAGRLLPQARVRTTDGTVTWLDEMVGNRWAFIGHGRDPGTQLDPQAREWAQRQRAVLVAVTTPGSRAPTESGCLAVEDINRVLGTPRQPAITVVRPDGFLLGALPAPLTATHLLVTPSITPGSFGPGSRTAGHP